MVRRLPAAFFGIVLGLIGLGNAWRAAHQVWGLPQEVGETVMASGVVVYAVLIILFAAKWIVARDTALSEALHPVQCCFIGLAGVATMLVGLAVLPYARTVATVAFVTGGLFTVVFGVWRTGVLWQGGRETAHTTPVLYLPTVAGGFVLAIASQAIGQHDVAQLAFGMAALSWLAVESVLVQRFYTVTLPPALRPTLGIQIAPPAVGAAAYLAINGGVPDFVAYVLVGYACLQTLIMLRLLPWITKQPFGAGYWAFTFGLTALATATVRLAGHPEASAMTYIAPVTFGLANIVVGVTWVGSLALLVRGKLLPELAPAPLAPPVAAS